MGWIDRSVRSWRVPRPKAKATVYDLRRNRGRRPSDIVGRHSSPQEEPWVSDFASPVDTTVKLWIGLSQRVWKEQTAWNWVLQAKEEGPRQVPLNLIKTAPRRMRKLERKRGSPIRYKRLWARAGWGTEIQAGRSLLDLALHWTQRSMPALCAR